MKTIINRQIKSLMIKDLDFTKRIWVVLLIVVMMIIIGAAVGFTDNDLNKNTSYLLYSSIFSFPSLVIFCHDDDDLSSRQLLSTLPVKISTIIQAKYFLGMGWSLVISILSFIIYFFAGAQISLYYVLIPPAISSISIMLYLFVFYYYNLSVAGYFLVIPIFGFLYPIANGWIDIKRVMEQPFVILGVLLSYLITLCVYLIIIKRMKGIRL